MADVVGLIVSIADLHDRLRTYGKAVKESREQITQLFNELSALKGVLDQIQHLQVAVHSNSEDDPDLDKLIRSPSFHTVLDDTARLLQSLSIKIEPQQGLRQKKLQSLKWPFHKEDVVKQLNFLERVKSWLLLALMTDDAHLSRSIHTDLQQVKGIIELDHQDRVMQKRSAELQHIRETISDIDPTMVHMQSCKAWEQLPENGNWFLKRDFATWYSAPDTGAVNQVLWLKGKSGAGKTTLFSHGVETVKTYAQNTQSKGLINVAYFYCAFNDVASQDPKQILAALLVQFSELQPDILGRLRPLVQQKKPLDPAAIQDSIIEAANSSQQLLIMIDAVNESRKVFALLSDLQRLLSKAPNIRLFLTSTPDVTEEALKRDHGLSKIYMRPLDIADDIGQYVQMRIDTSRTMSSMAEIDRENIKTVLTNQADGMFRFVQCQLDYLCAQRTGRAVKRALTDLPEDLNAAYTAALCRISDGDDKRYAKNALLWLSYSLKPLSLAQLAEAVVVEEDMETIGQEDRLVPPETILQICQGLIDINENTGLVALAHTSVRTFLTSSSILKTKAEYFHLDDITASRYIIRSCITYLTFEDFAGGYTGRRRLLSHLDQDSFLDYAATRWAMHASDTSRFPESAFTDSDCDLILDFFNTYDRPKHGNYGFWVRFILPEATKRTVAASQPLYYAASYGLTSVVARLLCSGLISTKDSPRDEATKWHIDAKGGRFTGTALQVASYRGLAPIVSLLLSAGASTKVTDSRGRTPLVVARRGGWTKVAELLVAHGAQEQPVEKFDQQDRAMLDETHAKSEYYRLEEAHAERVKLKAQTGSADEEPMTSGSNRWQSQHVVNAELPVAHRMQKWLKPGMKALARERMLMVRDEDSSGSDLDS